MLHPFTALGREWLRLFLQQSTLDIHQSSFRWTLQTSGLRQARHLRQLNDECRMLICDWRRVAASIERDRVETGQLGRRLFGHRRLAHETDSPMRQAHGGPKYFGVNVSSYFCRQFFCQHPPWTARQRRCVAASIGHSEIEIDQLGRHLFWSQSFSSRD